MNAADSNIIHGHILNIQPGTAILINPTCCGMSETFIDVIKRSNSSSAFAHALIDDQSDIWVDNEAFPEIFAGDFGAATSA